MANYYEAEAKLLSAGNQILIENANKNRDYCLPNLRAIDVLCSLSSTSNTEIKFPD